MKNLSTNLLLGLLMVSLSFSQNLPALIDIQFIDSHHGWIYSNAGDILVPQNSGTQWYRLNRIRSTRDNYFSASRGKIHLINDTLGFALGSNSTYSKIYRTTDGGENWWPVDSLNFFCAIHFFDDIKSVNNKIWLLYNAFCIIEPQFEHGFVFSADLDSLQLHEIFFQKGGLRAITTISPDFKWVVGSLYDQQAGKHRGVIYFNNDPDGQGEWSIQFVDSLEGRILRSVAFIDSLDGWACGDKGVILNTMDGGNKWFEQNSNTDKSLTDIYFHDDLVGWAVGWEGVILKTVNGGQTWAEQFSATSENLLAVAAISVDTAWVVGTRGALLHTFDGGVTWNPSLITHVESIPETMLLLQNYPNPFNPETTIEYELAKPGQVQLTIYNLLGQRVRTLVDAPQPAGRYQVSWDGRVEQGAGSVASGVYVYELKLEEKVIRMKMALIK